MYMVCICTDVSGVEGQQQTRTFLTSIYVVEFVVLEFSPQIECCLSSKLGDQQKSE